MLDPPRSGLGQVLRESIVRHRRGQLQVVDSDGWEDPAPPGHDMRQWLSDVEAAPCESLSYRRAVIAYLEACVDEDRSAMRKLEAWLVGERPGHRSSRVWCL